MLQEYEKELVNRELAKSTREKYIKDVGDFLRWADGKEPSQELLLEYKDMLVEKFKPSTVNNKIIILNNYFTFRGKGDVKAKQVKVQKRNVLDDALSLSDFQRLVRMTEKKGMERERIMLLSLFWTGLRVSELKFLTVEALKNAKNDGITVRNKGKTRTVPIAPMLEKELKRYCKRHDIKSGPIVLSRRKQPISRYYVYKAMQYLAGQARVKKSKCHPHAIRHLFAVQYLESGGNVLNLADMLGHSDLSTTRIYTKLSTKQARETINFNY